MDKFQHYTGMQLMRRVTTLGWQTLLNAVSLLTPGYPASLCMTTVGTLATWLCYLTRGLQRFHNGAHLRPGKAWREE